MSVEYCIVCACASVSVVDTPAVSVLPSGIRSRARSPAGIPQPGAHRCARARHSTHLRTSECVSLDATCPGQLGLSATGCVGTAWLQHKARAWLRWDRVCGCE